MSVDKIKELLKKYFEGSTQLEEETFLQDYFNSGEVSEELETYRHHFQFFSDYQKNSKAIVPDDEVLFSKIEKENALEGRQISLVDGKHKGWLKYAASIGLVLLGFSIGYYVGHFGEAEQGKLAAAKTAAEDNHVILAGLSGSSSASERIMTVNEASSMEKVDAEVLDALINTMNTDDNINVRLAAIEALSGLSAHEAVKSALIRSLSKQDNALVQIALIDIIVKLGEKGGINQIQRLMIDDKVDKVVKQRAQEGIAVLM